MLGSFIHVNGGKWLPSLCAFDEHVPVLLSPKFRSTSSEVYWLITRQTEHQTPSTLYGNVSDFHDTSGTDPPLIWVVTKDIVRLCPWCTREGPEGSWSNTPTTFTTTTTLTSLLYESSINGGGCPWTSGDGSEVWWEQEKIGRDRYTWKDDKGHVKFEQGRSLWNVNDKGDVLTGRWTRSTENSEWRVKIVVEESFQKGLRDRFYKGREGVQCRTG